MHPFWEVQDVVSEIILLLSKADKTRIARVNKRLWELTIPHIWRVVPDVRHFFNLFPSDLWIPVQGKSMFPPPLERGLRNNDWSRFLFHSKRTRSIYYSIGSLRNIVPPLIWSHPLLSTSFPILERLSVGVVLAVGEGLIDIFSLLLRPSLRHVEFCTQIPDSSSLLVGPLGTIAESNSLSLEEMTFISRLHSGPLGGLEAKAIASQTGLRRLTFSSMSDITAIVECAKNLPFLEELDVGTSQVYSRLPERDPAVGFRSLTTLAVTGVPADIHDLLHTIGSDRLARVALNMRHSIRRAGGIHPGLVTEMQRFRSHLLHLHLDLNEPYTWQDLEPVLALVRLQTFGLAQFGWRPPPITDAQLRQMVDSWPHLTRFRLISTALGAPRLTLWSLASIAFNCPNLKKLAITFDARQDLNQKFSGQVDALSESSENGLELLDVVGSKFDEGDEERLADEVFRLWWPRARFCQSNSKSKPSTYWEIDDAPSWPRGER